MMMEAMHQVSTKHRMVVVAVGLWVSMVSVLASGVLRDPTKPPDFGSDAQSANVADFQLQSIVVSNHGKRAMINGNWLIVGNTLGEWKVVGIEATVVTLSGPFGKRELKVFQSLGGGYTDIKKPASSSTGDEGAN